MIKANDNLYLYHYNKCSKSRQVKKFLDIKNISYIEIDYINKPLDSNLLKQTLETLKNNPSEIIRQNEKTFKELDKNLIFKLEDNLFRIILTYPILLQRPIVSFKRNGFIVKSILCRPPELIKDIV